LQNSQPSATINNTNEEEDEETEAVSADSEIFDLPRSWVAKLTVSKQEFASKCPSGSKIMAWRNCKLEIFAPYHRPDGMYARLTIFSDQKRNILGEIYERFDNRKDKLKKRLRVPSTGMLYEFFERGRPHALQEHVLENGLTVRIRFYREARSDGLYVREETPRKIIERFADREDRLVYRSVTHDISGDGEEETMDALNANRNLQVNIMKMTEKYDRSPRSIALQNAIGPFASAKIIKEVVVPSNDPYTSDSGVAAFSDEKEVYKRSFMIRDEKIRVVYHTDSGCIIATWREFKKPSPEQKTSFMDLTTSFETDILKKVLKKQHLYAKLCELLKDEQSCLHAVKASDREVKEILLVLIYL
jgi:hypothetical protein